MRVSRTFLVKRLGLEDLPGAASVSSYDDS